MINRAIVVKLIRVFLGAVFILSAVAKIYSMDFFDALVAKQLLGKDFLDNYEGYYWVQWLTRVIIAGEFMLGVAVLQEKHLKKIVFPSIIILLFVFILQIVYAASFQGKGYIDGNCGCFGDIIPFDNMETIIKNVVMIALTLLASNWYREGRSMNIPPVVIPYVVGIVTFITLAIPIEKMEAVTTTGFDSNTTVFTPTTKAVQKDTVLDEKNAAKVDSLGNLKEDTELNKTTDSNKDTDHKSALNLPLLESGTKIKTQVDPRMVTKSSSVFAPYTNFSNGEVKNLDEGTHLICLFKYSCGHCQDTYKEILELQKKGGNFGGLYILGFGSDFDKKGFWSQTGGVVAPHITVQDYTDFGRLLKGDDFPKIIVVKNGVTQKEWTIDNYSKTAMFDYFGVKENKKDVLPKTDEISIPAKKELEIEIDKPSGSPWD